MNKDRFGNERCLGYKKEDYVLCEKCCPDGVPDEKKLSTKCKLCGGYGEYPKECKDLPLPN